MRQCVSAAAGGKRQDGAAIKKKEEEGKEKAKGRERGDKILVQTHTRFLFLGQTAYFFLEKDVKIKPFHVRLSYLIISLAVRMCARTDRE